jgi:repressor LexA
MANEKDMNKEVFPDRLRELMNENNETTRSIADIVHLSHSTISRYLKGKISPKVPTIEKLANHFDVNPVWLLGYNVPKYVEGEKIKGFKEIPILGSIAAGQPVFAEENIKEYAKVPSEKVKNGQYFYLEVSGDSMIGAGIYEEDLVLVRKQDDVENKEIAVVMVNAHDATLKRVFKQNGNVILQPENPKYDPIIIKSEDARIIGKVVGLTRSF